MKSFTAVENSEDKSEGKIMVLRPSGDVQEAAGNIAGGFKRKAWEETIDQ